MCIGRCELFEPWPEVGPLQSESEDESEPEQRSNPRNRRSYIATLARCLGDFESTLGQNIERVATVLAAREEEAPAEQTLIASHIATMAHARRDHRPTLSRNIDRLTTVLATLHEGASPESTAANRRRLAVKDKET